MSVLARRVKALRDNKGWIQDELAQASGVAQSHISRLEKGRAPQTSGIVLAKLAPALGTTIDFLCGLTDDPSSRPNPTEVSAAEHALADPRLRYVVETWPELDEMFRDALHQVMQACKERMESQK